MWEQTQTLSFLLMELGWNDLISLQQDKHFQIKLKTEVRLSLSNLCAGLSGPPQCLNSWLKVSHFQ